MKPEPDKRVLPSNWSRRDADSHLHEMNIEPKAGWLDVLIVTIAAALGIALMWLVWAVTD